MLRALYSNAYLLLAVTMVLWGGNAIAARLAVGEISPMILTGGRWFFVAGFLLVFNRRAISEAMPVFRQRWRYVVAMGTMGFTMFNALMYVAAKETSAFNLTLLQGSMPAIVLIGAWIFFRTPIRALQYLGIGITLFGVALVAAGGQLDRLAALAFNRGDLMMLLACVCYAGYTLGLRQRPNISGLAFFSGIVLVAFAISIPFMAAEYALGYGQLPTPKGWLILAYVAVAPSFLAQMFFMRGVDLIGPERAGLFVNLVPVAGAFLAVMILNEPFGWYHAIALALVLGGIAIAEQGRGKTRAP